MLSRTLSRYLRASLVHDTHALVRLRASRAPAVAPTAVFTCTTRSMHASRAWLAEAETTKPELAKEREAAAAPGETGQAEGGSGGASEDGTAKEVEAVKKDLLKMTDNWKRSIAEYRNLQEQTKREVTAAREFAIQRFAKDLVESVDNLDRALETVPKDKLTDENKDLVTLHDGLKMTETIMLQTLKKHGLERFDPAEKGDKFDPNRHEATFQVVQPDKEDGTVFHVQQKGFLLNGRVLRAAKVGVVKNT